MIKITQSNFEAMTNGNIKKFIDGYISDIKTSNKTICLVAAYKLKEVHIDGFGIIGFKELEDGLFGFGNSIEEVYNLNLVNITHIDKTSDGDIIMTTSKGTEFLFFAFPVFGGGGEGYKDFIYKLINYLWSVALGVKKLRFDELRSKISKLLKEKAIKMPISDIDAFLKHKNIDEIKEVCQLMYKNDEIGYAGNGRYFILNPNKKKAKAKKASAPKSEAVDVKAELKKYKEMLDEGLITQEQYDAKSNELLGL